MTFIADTPTLGLLVWTPIAVVLVLACVGLALYTWRRAQRDDYNHGELIMVAGAAGVVALLLAAGTAIGMWPWKHDYHFWVPKGGEVQQVSKRLVPAGDGMQEKVVFLINGQPYGVLDTRASLVKKGDVVDIACKRAYEWGSRDHGWDCRWNGEATRDG